MSNSKKNQDSSWLTDNGRPAEQAILMDAAFKSLSFFAQILQWVGLSLVAQYLLNQLAHKTLSHRFLGLSVANVNLSLSLLIVGVGLNIVFFWLDQRGSARAVALAIAARTDRLLPELLPSKLRLDRLDPAQGASYLMERIDEIASYQVKAKSMAIYARLAMTVIILLLLLVHWPAAILLLLATAVIPVNMWIAGRLAQEGQDQYLGQLNQLSAKILDSFLGLATLKRFRGISQRREVIQQASDELTDTNYAILKRAFISGMVMDIVVTFSIAVVATYVGFNLMGYWGVPGTHLTLAEGLFVLLLAPMYFTPFREMASAFHDKERANAAVRLLDELPSAEPEIVVKSGQQPLTIAPSIALTEVTFAYSDYQPIIDSFTATVASGETIALIGASGAGKTTLLNILSGVLVPTEGNITWMAQEATRVAEIEQSTWLGQQFLLLQGTLRENLALANPDARDGQLIAALGVAQLEDWFAGLPDGLDTILGYANIQPSAGEQKRLAIARAAVKNSPIWFVDEPTSHLDDENATLVIDALQATTAEATVVMATHDPRVVAVSDQIWRINGHGLVEVLR
jgi:ATP-binding cassette subfamily C protein CydD